MPQRSNTGANRGSPLGNRTDDAERRENVAHLTGDFRVLGHLLFQHRHVSDEGVDARVIGSAIFGHGSFASNAAMRSSSVLGIGRASYSASHVVSSGGVGNAPNESGQNTHVPCTSLSFTGSLPSRAIRWRAYLPPSPFEKHRKPGASFFFQCRTAAIFMPLTPES